MSPLPVVIVAGVATLGGLYFIVRVLAESPSGRMGPSVGYSAILALLGCIGAIVLPLVALRGRSAPMAYGHAPGY
jgi:hypothetical protein